MRAGRHGCGPARPVRRGVHGAEVRAARARARQLHDDEEGRHRGVPPDEKRRHRRRGRPDAEPARPARGVGRRAAPRRARGAEPEPRRAVAADRARAAARLRGGQRVGRRQAQGDRGPRRVRRGGVVGARRRDHEVPVGLRRRVADRRDHGPSVKHEYGKGSRGTYVAYVEAKNTLTRTGVGSATVTIKRR